MEHGYSLKTNDYASRFNLWKKKTAMSFIEMAKVVVEAKDTLEKDDFGQFTALIGHSTTSSFISKLYRIGLQAEVFEKHIDLLPSSFTTLYALTTVKQDELVDLFEENRIHPRLKGSEVGQLVKTQKRYRSSRVRHPERCASNGIIMPMDHPIERSDPIALQIDASVTKTQLIQFLRQLDLLTRFEGVRVTVPTSIHQRIAQEEREVDM